MSATGRWRGALAGLLPMVAVALIFAVGTTSAREAEVALSLAIVAGIGVSAGWLVGPIAARRPHRPLRAAAAYAIALLAANGLLSVVQGGWDAWISDGFDPLAIAGASIGRALYAVVGSAYMIVPAFGAGVLWRFVFGLLDRGRGERPDDGSAVDEVGNAAAGTVAETAAGPDLAGASSPAGGASAGPDDVDLAPPRDPRRLGLAAAGIIAGYALVVGAISAGLVGDLVDTGPRPPELVPRPLLLVALLSIPAAVAAAGAVARSRPTLLAAGVIDLLQSFVAFSGVTIPFVVPALLLFGIGGGGEEGAEDVRRREALGAFAVVLLALAAWVSLVGLTETRCWVARISPDGTLIYAETPVSDTVTLGEGQVAGGCDSGSPTFEGAGLASVLGIGAIAIAGLLAASRATGSRRRRSSDLRTAP